MIRLRVLTLLIATLLLACSFAQAAQVHPAPEGEKQKLTEEVYRIFEAKCADCHGSHLPKPKGKFGYVLDLARVAKNSEYIERGNPAGSELYQMVLHNEMPGEDADVPPLTPEELKVIERWVLIGAPTRLPETFVPATPGTKSLTASIPLTRRVLNWLGKFHPVSTHLPVGLLMAAVLAEAIAWWLRRAEWLLLVRFLVILGALSSVPTATLGWLANFPTTPGSQLALVYSIHKWLGTATAAWALTCAILLCMGDCPEGSPARIRFRGALLLGAAMISITGFLGGAMTFGGLEHYKF